MESFVKLENLGDFCFRSKHGVKCNLGSVKVSEREREEDRVQHVLKLINLVLNSKLLATNAVIYYE